MVIILNHKKIQKKNQIKNEDIEQVDKMKYLLRSLDYGRFKFEIINSIKNRAIEGRLFEDEDISESPKTQSANLILVDKMLYIHSILFYGAEAWIVNADLMRKPEAFEMWLFGRI